jgi:hypothetical protein
MEPLQYAILSAITALITSSLVVYFTQFLKSKAEREQETKTLNLKYLNPLRLYLEENHLRLNEILNRIEDGGGKCDILVIDETDAISEQKAEWFNGKGCYLISTCYLTAGLFYQIQRVRDEFAYLRLGKQKDTVLLNLMVRVSLSFLQDLGIFYATQPSIGLDMYLPEEARMRSYREFTQLLQDPKKRVWFDRLINFYVETGKGQKIPRVEKALSAIEKLSLFLDKAVKGGASIQSRYEAEGISRKRLTTRAPHMWIRPAKRT